MKLSTKFLMISVGVVLLTAFALVCSGIWQSRGFSDNAQHEVDKLLDANFTQITDGVYNLIKSQDQLLQQQISGSLAVARHLQAQRGQFHTSSEMVTWKATNQLNKVPQDVKLPRFLMGGTWLGHNANVAVETPLVDTVMKLTGASVTVFQRMNKEGDMLRVATNIVTDTGTRAIGTYIPAVNPDGTQNPVTAAVLGGQTYHGNAFVVNAWFVSCYEPIMDASGAVIGALFVGVKQESVPALRKAIQGIKVGAHGAVAILGAKGTIRGQFLITPDSKQDGQNVWDAKDADGKTIYQDIVNKALPLTEGQCATFRYQLKAEGEAQPKWIAARASYYAPWNWVIVTSAPESDFASFHESLDQGRSHMTWSFIVIAVIIALLSGCFCWMWASRIAAPLRQMVHAADALAQGDTDQRIVYSGSDEIGSLAISFDHMIDYMRQMAQAARTVSEGDLTQTVEPRSSKDVLGTAFAHMVEELRRLIAALSGNVRTLSATSRRLAESANETDSAATRMAETIHDVAKAANESAKTSQEMATGSEKQAHVSTDAAFATDRLHDAIRNVEASSKQQQQAIHQANQGMSESSDALTELIRSTEQMAGTARVASEVAAEGSKAVQQTVERMSRIRAQVEMSSSKVLELGRQGQEIGAIVETIDQIAEQTNLLALNAAIEAARAGENGKGFAVVADEVRKLAERSAASTREIGKLIESVRHGVEEAVEAMQSSSKEVALGAQCSGQAGEALNKILETVESVASSVAEVTSVSSRMAESISSIQAEMTSVRELSERNESIVTEMVAGADQVSATIATVASITQETAAGAEEMSASAQEVSAGAETVATTINQQLDSIRAISASAAELDSLSQQTRELTQQFKSVDSDEPEDVSQLGGTAGVRNKKGAGIRRAA